MKVKRKNNGLHIAAHIGLDLLFTATAAISAVSAIAGNDTEEDQKYCKDLGCFSHLNIKDTTFKMLSKL